MPGPDGFRMTASGQMFVPLGEMERRAEFRFCPLLHQGILWRSLIPPPAVPAEGLNVNSRGR